MKNEGTVLAHLAGRFTIQTENLATEALAYILTRSVAARAAIQVIAQSVGCLDSENLVYETQLANQDGSRPDIIGKSADGTVRLLIEAKFWAGLTEAQPLGYLRSFVAPGGLLLIVAPEQRLFTLWAELCRRLETAQPSMTLQLGFGQRVRVGDHNMALVSWRELLNRMIGQVDAAGDLSTVADLKQLAGLADRMDSTAFLPLTSEELTSTLGRRIVQFCTIVNDLTEKLVSLGLGNLKGLRSVGTFGAYSRYIALQGYGAVLQFSSVNWTNWGDSPVWLGIKGEDWKPSAKVREALSLARIEFREAYTYCYVPIFLTIGVEKERILQDALAQIQKVLSALPDATKALISEPPALEIIENSSDEEEKRA